MGDQISEWAKTAFGSAEEMEAAGRRYFEEHAPKVDPSYLRMIQDVVASMSPAAQAEFEQGWRARVTQAGPGVYPTPLPEIWRGR